jgi:hypothetical protein
MQLETLVLNSQWTAFIAGVMPPELIGRKIAPFTPADFISGLTINYWKFNPDYYLRMPVTQVDRRGTIPMADFQYTTATTTLNDHGMQILTDVADEAMFPASALAQTAQVLLPPLTSIRMAKLKAIAEQFWLSHEQEVQALVHTSAGYDAGNVVNVGDPLDPTNPTGGSFVALDDPDVDPLPMLTTLIDRPLIKPDTMVMGLAVWRPLQRNAKLIQFVKGLAGVVQVGSNLLEPAQLAAALGLKQIIVGEQRANFSDYGIAASYSRIWGKNLCTIRVEPAPMNTIAPYPGSVLTAFGKRIVQLDEDGDMGRKGSLISTEQPVFVASNFIKPGQANGGLYGAYQDIIGHTRKVLAPNTNAGCVYLNCVTENV